jgi:hypothetical protein
MLVYIHASTCLRYIIILSCSTVYSGLVLAFSVFKIFVQLHLSFLA